MYELLGTQPLVTGRGSVDIMSCWVSVLGRPPPECSRGCLHMKSALKEALRMTAKRPPLPRGGHWE
eukprot:10817700-Alexandrium_andersonii.AAC.1